MSETIDPALYEMVSRSYGRHAMKSEFWDAFYEDFFSRSTEIRTMFRKTDLEKQKQIMRQSLGFVLMYISGKNERIAERKLTEVGKIHDKEHRNVRPDMYTHWIEALIATFKKFDGDKFDADLEKAWRKALAPAIMMLKMMYKPKIA